MFNIVMLICSSQRPSRTGVSTQREMHDDRTTPIPLTIGRVFEMTGWNSGGEEVDEWGSLGRRIEGGEL